MFGFLQGIMEVIVNIQSLHVKNVFLSLGKFQQIRIVLTCSHQLMNLSHNTIPLLNC